MGIRGWIRVIAILSSGLTAGVLFGDRMGASFARPALSSQSFVRFQQILHGHFVQFMPGLTATGVLAVLAWLIMARAQWKSPGFWLVASAAGVAVAALVLTLAVNIPINDQLMTWSVAAPPDDVREIWSRWESTHTVRTLLWMIAFALEVVALALVASASAPDRTRT